PFSDKAPGKSKFDNRYSYLQIWPDFCVKIAQITENQEISCLWLKNTRCTVLLRGQGRLGKGIGLVPPI
ncbi:MAG: hypothetical protein WBQ22_05475, partial [Bradyrhizobium sp.]